MKHETIHEDVSDESIDVYCNGLYSFFYPDGKGITIESPEGMEGSSPALKYLAEKLKEYKQRYK